MTENQKKYFPRGRFLIDILLVTDVLFLLIYAVSTVYFTGFVIAALVFNVLEILIWFTWVRKVFTITVTETTVTGPSPELSRKTLQLAQIDKWKTENLSGMTKKKGFVDIWTLDGARVRIFRTILGRGQCYFILESVLRGYGSYGDPVRKIIVPYPNE
jgi:hypothetical protein